MKKVLGVVVLLIQAVFACYAAVTKDYTVMAECLVGVLLIILPNLIDKKLKLDLPSALYVVYYVFIFAAIFLGSGLHFYSRISFWDDILHSLSAALLAALGFTIMQMYNQRAKQVQGNISAALMAVFAFCFALAIGAVWEIYEYTGDGLLNMNMQRFLNAQGNSLIGRAALFDTMKDIIVDATSALVTSVIGGILIHQRRKSHHH